MVLHSDAANGWTEEKAEDLLDDNEEAIARVIDENRHVEGVWKSILRLARSDAERVEIGGNPYLLEVILLDFEELQ